MPHSLPHAKPRAISGLRASYDHKARLRIPVALTQDAHLSGTRLTLTVEPARIRRRIHLELDAPQQLVQRAGVEIALKHTILHAPPEILEGLHDAPAAPIVNSHHTTPDRASSSSQ